MVPKEGGILIQIGQKCFGDAPTKRMVPAYSRRHARDVMKRGLTCPTSVSALASIAEEAIPADR